MKRNTFNFNFNSAITYFIKQTMFKKIKRKSNNFNLILIVKIEIISWLQNVIESEFFLDDERKEKKRVFKVLQPLCKMPTHIITFIGAISQNKRVHKHTEKYAISTMTPCIRSHTYQFNYHLNHTFFHTFELPKTTKLRKVKKATITDLYNFNSSKSYE